MLSLNRHFRLLVVCWLGIVRTENLASFDIELVEHDKVSHASHVVKKQGPSGISHVSRNKIGNRYTTRPGGGRSPIQLSS